MSGTQCPKCSKFFECVWCRDLARRLDRAVNALKKCDEEFDALAQVEDDPVEYGRYVGLRAMIEDTLKE
jgi:hypothetical protein